MLYALIENLIFLVIAAFLGGVIGWLLRAPRLRSELETIWRRRCDEERAARSKAQDRLTEAQSELTLANEREAGLSQEVEQAQRSLAKAVDDTANAKQEKTKLASELAAAKKAAAGAEKGKAELERVKGRLAEAETSAKALERKLADQERAQKSQTEQLAAAHAELAAYRERLTSEPPPPAPAEEESDAEDEPASARSAVEAIARRTAGEGAQEDDDLKQIKGIGPVLERQLKELGITSFRQIAQLTDADIDRLSDALGAFRGRILRDNWPDGARAAYRRQYGEEV